MRVPGFEQRGCFERRRLERRVVEWREELHGGLWWLGIDGWWSVVGRG
jgi:hypothetical protein